jgi:excisionase family DNA binding protein
MPDETMDTGRAGVATSLGMAPVLLSVPEAAAALGIGRTLLWELIRRGEVPNVRLGRRVLVARSDLEALAARSVSRKDRMT